MVVIRIDSETLHRLDDTPTSLHGREKSDRKIRDRIITWPEKWGGSRKSFCHFSCSFLKRMLKHSWSSAFVMAGCESTNARSLKQVASSKLLKLSRRSKEIENFFTLSTMEVSRQKLWTISKKAVRSWSQRNSRSHGFDSTIPAELRGTF